MNDQKTIEVPIRGMDCAECTQHVRKAIAGLPGVSGVEVFLGSEKAVIQLDPKRVQPDDIQKAVEGAGYSVGQQPEASQAEAELQNRAGAFTRQVLTLLGVLFAVVLFVVVVGEWLGLFEAITSVVPFPVGAAIVLVAGFPVFRNVVRAALKRQVIAHTLMSVGVLAALAVGQWATAVVVVFFMRVGDYAEHFTTERARRAVKDLTALAPQTARVERQGAEVQVQADQVLPGEIVVVRPGEKVPVDGVVASGHAVVEQAAITGESMPVEAGPGAKLFASAILKEGSLRVETQQAGANTTFGRVIRLVEQAEANRASVQRVADVFSAYYLPVVGAIALLTYLVRRDPLATAAVLVVACSCSFALATPIAMLASIGAGARHGLLIKGGKYLESLAKADVLLIDKTGTLTLGRPQVVDVRPAGELPETELLRLAAAAERYSEHPLAEAVRKEAARRGVQAAEPQGFESKPGVGVWAQVDGRRVGVGSRRLVSEMAGGSSMDTAWLAQADELEQQGKTLLYITCDGQPAGLIAASDTLRSEVPAALAELRGLGIRHIELLTGDNPQAASLLVKSLEEQAGGQSLTFRANLLPEDKIEVVRQYQAAKHTVVMVGDGINDAPALAQADVGIAMGAAGTDIAIEAAHIALIREDWSLVPEVVRIAQRTMRVVKMNIFFTGIYNLVGLSLAAAGLLPPFFAAAAQSLPDIGILANSSRLLRQK